MTGTQSKRSRHRKLPLAPAPKLESIPERVTLGLRWYDVLIAFAALVFVCRALLVGLSLATDDAFITYRFAWNNAHGYWFQWNAGGPAVYGTTTFLYTMLLTVVGALGISIPLASIILSGIAQTAAAYFAYLLVKRWGDELTGVLAGILVASDGFGIVVAQGMETYVYVALLMGGLYFYQVGKLEWAALFAGLLGMTRLDGFLLAAILGIHYLITVKKIPWRAVGVFAVVIAPWFVMSQTLFGSIMPQSLAAKHLHRIINTSGHYSMMQMPLLLGWIPFIVLPVLALYLLWRSRRHWRQSGLLLLSLFIAGNIAAYYIAKLPNFHWYYVPPVIGVWVLAAAAIFYLPVKWRWGFAGLLCVLSLMVSYRNRPETWMNQDWNGTACKGAADWLKENAKPGESLAAYEIGTVGFYNPRLIVHDMMGLVSPEAIRNLQMGRLEKSLEDWQPDYVFMVCDPWYKMTRPIFFPEMWYAKEKGLLPHINEQWLEKYRTFFPDHYDIVASWPRGTRPDGSPINYILARKKRAENISAPLN
jgi:hypothetical protein